MRWNAADGKFEVATTGPGRIRGFVLDDSVSLSEKATDQREGVFAVAQEGSWIWDYVDAAPAVPTSSSGIPTYKIGDTNPLPTTVGPPAVGNALLAPPVATGRAPLDPPIFSVPSTTRPIIEFDIGIALSNPNPDGSSSVYFSRDYGAWSAYDGNVIPVAPDTVIQAQSISKDRARFSNSRLSQEQYKATPLKLEPPLIGSTRLSFLPIGGEEAEVSLKNPNDPSLSSLEYRINGTGWGAYAVPFTITMTSFPAGAAVEARAVGASKYFLTSDIALLSVGAPPQQLDPPLIDFSHEAFSDDKNDPVSQITAVLNNPNPSQTSAIQYKILPLPGKSGNATDYQDYSGSFVVPRFLYLDGFSVVAYAKSVAPNYEDSVESRRLASAVPGVLGGHLDLDTSDFLSSIGSGSTSAHTHDITGKYGLTSINFFAIPDSDQLEINEAITNQNQRFKLSVLNADLSPGMKLVMTHEVDGVAHQTEMAVDEYDNIPLESLPALSLGNKKGIPILTSLRLQFNKDLIYEAAVVPTNTGDVKGNVPGKNGEWRNGSLTLQAIAVNMDGSDAFSTDPSRSAGSHGAATSGLLWEASLFWHWEGDSYHESGNGYVPGDYSTVQKHVSDKD